eukprot:CAMPEP_0184013508 /NCGR_PEP_ID=MMETSP0954-20121128/5059_1 /TAXON_ID=627963 /ORGANISM="Aplanochytrium sp, Strain PBS07" /LENGTH=994 /DNA_ID=CAMNT_0026293719 /DNA_START=171 /DNA_END=3152 /DNA_ORIENTATION=+
MPLRLEIKKKLSSRSDRVKSVDIHPTEPLVLSSLYSGHIFIWNYETQTMLKSFEATDQPVRCAKFITRKQWFIAGSDDMFMRVFNYNTMEKVKEFEAHIDYIRCIEVHPTLPYVLSASDDMQIKLWDWEKGWVNTQIFEGHAHYVMSIKFNPKDTNTFATASLDRSVKVWSLGSPLPNYSLEGHEQGVNCLDYFTGGEKPYLVSGADDLKIKIWDYQTKSCVQTLDGHTGNVSAVMFHPKLPIIRLETTLNYGLERAWSLAVARSSNKVAIGYDEGTIVIQLGQEEPVVSMDSSGKILMANNNEVVSCTVRNTGQAAVDGEPVEIPKKDLGSCEIYPQSLIHNSNGRFVVACGDGEYIIYTAQALRNKSFGSAVDFAWSSEGTGDYAVRDSASNIKIFKNFKEVHTFKPPFSVENMWGGPFIALQGNEFVLFVDWEMGKVVRRIDVAPKKVLWSQNGDLVALVCEDSYFVLQCDRDGIADAFANGTADEGEGVDGSFDLVHEIGESVGTGEWVGDCFLYTNLSGTRMNYYVGGEVITLCHLDRQMYLLGYVARENHVYLIDRNGTIVSYQLLEGILQYQTAVVRQDFDLANEILPSIPRDQYNDIARFLEAQGFKEVALQVADDPDLKFDLALQLENFQVALDIMKAQKPDSSGSSVEQQQRWKQLGDLALANGELVLAEECALYAEDYAGLLLMYTASGDRQNIMKLADLALANNRYNIAFMCNFLTNNVESCAEILQKAGRVAEAAFFVQTYLPSKLNDCVEAWKEVLPHKVSQSIANPQENPEEFPTFQLSLQAEKLANAIKSKGPLPASKYAEAINQLDLDLLDVVKNNGSRDILSEAVPSAVTPPAAEAPPVADTFPEPITENLPEQVTEALPEPVTESLPEPAEIADPPSEVEAPVDYVSTPFEVQTQEPIDDVEVEASLPESATDDLLTDPIDDSKDDALPDEDLLMQDEEDDLLLDAHDDFQDANPVDDNDLDDDLLGDDDDLADW